MKNRYTAKKCRKGCWDKRLRGYEKRTANKMSRRVLKQEDAKAY